MYPVRKNEVNQILVFRVYNTDGSPKTDLTSATTGLSIEVARIGLTASSIVSLTDKAADNTAHSDGAIRAFTGNIYLIDVPDVVFTSDTAAVGIRGSFTGGYIEGYLQPLINYSPLVDIPEMGLNSKIAAQNTQI